MRFTNLILYMSLSWPLSGCLDQTTPASVEWKSPVRLPDASGEPAIGLAGPLVGIHQNQLFIGGGANFPGGLPWEGGAKVYHSLLHHYTIDEKEGLHFIKTTTIPEPTAYGASISTRDGIVYAGGEGPGGLSSRVWLLKNQDDSLLLSRLPDLPQALTNAAACAYQNHLYVAGGESLSGVSNRIYTLNLDDTAGGWKELSPVPYAVSHACFQFRNNQNKPELVLIGGRRKTDADTSELYKHCSIYDLQSDSWKEGPALPVALSAALAVTTEDQRILLFGGDDGRTFSRVEALLGQISRAEDSTQRAELVEQKNQLLRNHPGFQRTIYQLSLTENTWTGAGILPFEAPVTSQALIWKNRIFLPSGEIRAGVRSPFIQQAQLGTEPTQPDIQ
jgi:N-acetylneuraminate epimerase